MARKKADTILGTRSADVAEEKKPDEIVSFWLNEIAASRKREEDYRKDGYRIYDLYSGNQRSPYNILYSNTETTLPALYSAVPRPVVQRRFKDADPLGKEAASAGERGLEFMIDTNIEGYETYDEAMRSAVLDALLPGRGVSCVKYDAQFGEMQASTDSATPEPSVSAAPSPEGAVAQAAAEPTPYTKSELVCLESEQWDRVSFGYSKRWSKTPWIAYEKHVDKKEATRLFGPVADKLVFSKNDDKTDQDNTDGRGSDKSGTGDNNERNQGERKTALVYQVWDKDGVGNQGERKLLYVSPGYTDGYLKIDDDPLGITGFFNTPRPIKFVERNDSMTPVALYTLYEAQAKELNDLTRRITNVTRAIKAKALYDGSLGDDIKNIVEGDDNEFVAADKDSALAAEKGLEHAIWFWPVDKLIIVLRELQAARQACKQVIYEITGLSDIIRGSTVASETATAQELKSQWGTLRLKRVQKEVQRYARDLLRMMLEVAALKFSEDTWAKMTGLPYLTQAKVDELATIKQAMMQQQAQGQQVDPGTAQQIVQAESIPKWADVLKLLRDDTQRAYRIDIETNSTVEPEAAEDQKQITELFTAMGQYLNGVAPLIAKGVLPFGAAQSMLLAITRRFRFGTEIEDYIKAMQAPPPEGADEAAKAKQQAEAESQKAQADAKQAIGQAQQASQQAVEKAQRDTKAIADKAAYDKMIDDAKREIDKEKYNLALQKQELKHQQEMQRQQQSPETGFELGKDKQGKQVLMKRNAMKQMKEDDMNQAQLAQVLKQMNDMIVAVAQQMNEGNQALAQAVTQLAQTGQVMAQAAQAMAGPRKSTAVRGADGRITHALNEPVPLQ